MAYIVDITYFDGGELNIPGTEKTAVQEVINDLIAKYEPIFLKKALSYPLWKLFFADAYPVPITARFQALLNGAEFTVTNVWQTSVTKQWTGLNNTNNLSPIAVYVWYWYQRHKNSYNSVGGEVKAATENSKAVSPATKMMRAWNEMSNTVHLLWEFLCNAVNDDGTPMFPEFQKQQTGNFDKISIYF